MVNNSVILVASGSFFAGSSSGSAVYWQGGRTALTIYASVFGGGVFLQSLGMDGRTWININGTTYSANQVTAYDLPSGNYKIVSNASSSLSLQANLSTIPY